MAKVICTYNVEAQDRVNIFRDKTKFSKFYVNGAQTAISSGYNYTFEKTGINTITYYFKTGVTTTDSIIYNKYLTKVEFAPETSDTVEWVDSCTITGATLEEVRFTGLIFADDGAPVTGNIGSIVVSGEYDRFTKVNGCVLWDGKYLIMGEGGDIVIPDTVIRIEDNAFDGRTTLTSITIPNSVVDIFTYAFRGTSISSLNIPDSVTQVGTGIVYDCNSLTSVNIGSGLTEIAGYMFGDTPNLEKIVIPDSVTHIGAYAFGGCSKLSSVTIGSGLTTIDLCAFNVCTSLTSIELPSSLIEMGGGVFSGCENLSEIISNARTAPDIYLKDDVFYNVNPTGTLYIPAGSNYSEWTAQLPAGWETAPIFINRDEPAIICEYNVTETGVTQIGYDFSDIVSMYVDGVEQPLANGYSFETTGLHYIEYRLGDNWIPYEAFYFIQNLTSVYMNKHVNYVYHRAFFGCANLSNVVFSLDFHGILIGGFEGCNITSLTLPDSLREIGDTAFGRNPITAVTIPSGVTSIGLAPFLGCDNLKSIIVDGNNTYYHGGGNCIIETATNTLIQGCKYSDIPDGVTTIAKWAFYEAGLSSVTIPDSVTIIKDMAFYNCMGIKTLYLGTGLTTIEGLAFGYCEALDEIHITAPIAPAIADGSFMGVATGGTLYYPAGSDYSQWLSEDAYYLGYYEWNDGNGGSGEGGGDNPDVPDTGDTGTTTSATITAGYPNTFPATGGSQSFVVAYTNYSSIEVPQIYNSWLTLVATANDGGAYTYTFNASANPNTSMRTTTVKFICWGNDDKQITKTVQFTQNANTGGSGEGGDSGDTGNTGGGSTGDTGGGVTGDPDIIIETTPMDYSSWGGTQNVIVRYNNIADVYTPTVSSMARIAGIVTVTPIETLIIDEGTSRYRYSFNVDKNNDDTTRAFDVTFSGDSKTKTLTLNQNENTNTATYISLNKIRLDFPASGDSITVQASYWNTDSVLDPTISESWGSVTTVTSNLAPNPKAVLYKVTLPKVSVKRSCHITFSCYDVNGNLVQETLNVYQAEPEGNGVAETHDNYKAYFKSLEGKDYEIRLISNPDSQDYAEVLLGGESPFKVSYEGSDVLFEPIKKSTATITVVHDTYLEELLSPYAQGTQVQLLCNNAVEWSGYLTPKVYNQDWENEFETFELEASDCIASLQYLDYEPLNDRNLVTFKEILDDIVSKATLDGYYWPQSKIYNGGYLRPSEIGVYEKNFFTNDTDEPWTLYDVLFEICQFLGLTCVQCGSSLYLLDYNDYMAQSYTNSKYDFYGTGGAYASYWYMGYGNGVTEIDADSFRGNGGTISFTPIYNKVVVKDNMYVCEEIIPSIFEDEKLTNVKGAYYDTYEVEPITPYKALYPNGSGWGNQKYKEEEVSDEDYRYFLRVYDHKDYETVYDGTTTLWGGDPVRLLQNVLQGRIVDLGTVKNIYYEYGQKIVPNSVDYERYLCIPMKHTDEQQNTGKVVFRLKEGYKLPCMVSKDAFIVVQCSATFERYNGRAYINPDWTSAANNLHMPYNSGVFDRIAWPMFRLTIGDKTWSSFRNSWVELDDSHNYFETEMEWQQDNFDYWNKEIDCLNQVSWEDNVGEAGYKIPLDGVDLTQEIKFEVLCPKPSSYGRNNKSPYDYFMMKYNAYCWLSDLSLKIVEKGQDVERLDNDIIYENVIDQGSISEMSDIEFKLTTHSEMTKPSYSNVVFVPDHSFLETIEDRGLGSTGQNAEENCVERMVRQYSTPTKQLQITISNKLGTGTYNSMTTPFKVMGTSYIATSTEIDYAFDNETITLTEIKG